MSKAKIITAVAGVLLAIPFSAFASIDNVLFDNGSGSNSVASGSTVNMHLYVSSLGQDVESVYVKYPGAGGIAQQGQCYDISPDQIGTSPVGGWNISVPNVVAPVASGVWPVEVTTYGFSGDAADNNCTGASAMTFGPTNFSGRITVTADNSNGTLTQNSGGSTGTTVGGTTDTLSTILAGIQALLAKMSTPAPAPTPVPAGKCAVLSEHSVGAMYGVRNQANVVLQGYLLGEGASIPALAAGASFGFFGPQTQMALSNFKSANGCQ